MALEYQNRFCLREVFNCKNFIEEASLTEWNLHLTLQELYNLFFCIDKGSVMHCINFVKGIFRIDREMWLLYFFKVPLVEKFDEF